MRTSLTIDDDVLAAAKALAARQHKSVGEVTSALTRASLQPARRRAGVRNGIPWRRYAGDARTRESAS